ncbi:MAG: UbiA family prenyltransferase [Polyangiaceae bacterium]|nr:UbiA family prenyltransferase [Polyangiaceae bacterium]
MLGLLDSARIVADATVYRLKKREMGNLVTSATLALGLSLPLRDVAHRVAFGLALNVFVYLVNDLFDVEIDQRAEGRDVERTRFLAAHLGAGVQGAALVLGACAALAAAHGRDLLVVLGVNVVVIVLYSRWLKRRPVLDLLSMATWGTSMALVGCPLDSRPGWAMVGLLAILCMVTEGVQVIRDAETDAAAGVRTTAAALGVVRAAALTRALVLAASVYATLTLDVIVGPLLSLGLFTRLDTAHANQSWDRLRLLFGVGWLLIVGHFHLAGRLTGALS